MTVFKNCECPDYNYEIQKTTHNYCSLNNQFKLGLKLYYLANYQIFMSNLKMGAIEKNILFLNCGSY